MLNWWVFLFALIICIGGLATWFFWPRDRSDALLAHTYEWVAGLESYAQNVETQTELSDRHLSVRGIYLIDRPRSSFSSYSTTTIVIPDVPRDESTHSFALQAIAIHDDLYAKITTGSPLLTLTTPHMTRWTHFKKDAVPPPFTDIVFAGPSVDNLALFRNKDYVLLINKAEAPDGPQTMNYHFKLAPLAFQESSGPVKVLSERLGPSGLITLSVDTETAAIQYIHFENPPYFSTTTISTHPPISILPPPLSHIDATPR